MDWTKIDEGHSDEKSDTQFHFYYNRDERLKNAPKIVQDYYYEGKGKPVKGLFKALVSTRSNRILLFSIFIFSAFILMFSFLSSRNSNSFIGTQTNFKAFLYEDKIYISLKFNKIEKNADFVNIPVHAIFTAYESSGTECNRKEMDDIFSGDEMFIMTTFDDYDIMKVVCELSANDEKKTFAAKVNR